ncbi:MAG: PUA domain-containing protein [Candidatus Nanoarchaeia archaeon]
MRKQFSKSDIKEFIKQMPLAKNLISKKSKVVEENNKLFINDELAFIQEEKRGKWFPSLHILLSKKLSLPNVVVDKGAIRFVVKGADIMRPGIVDIDEFKKNDFVVIVDEMMKKPLAVGKALKSSQELKEEKEGKSIQSLHYFGDGYF